MSRPGPPWVVASMMAKVSKKAYTMLITSRKNVVGDSNGNWIVQKRRQGRAPSMAAASMSDFGIDCIPARKNKKLYEICFHTAAVTISAMAWVELRRWFHSKPNEWASAYDTTPMEGENMNTHNTPATAGATA